MALLVNVTPDSTSKTRQTKWILEITWIVARHVLAKAGWRIIVGGRRDEWIRGHVNVLVELTERLLLILLLIALIWRRINGIFTVKTRLLAVNVLVLMVKVLGRLSFWRRNGRLRATRLVDWFTGWLIIRLATSFSELGLSWWRNLRLAGSDSCSQLRHQSGALLWRACKCFISKSLIKLSKIIYLVLGLEYFGN